MSQTKYDEEKVPEYQLPDVLVTHDGQKVSDKEQWENLRRPEIMELFSKEMFGVVTDVEVDFDFEVTKHIAGVLDGMADLKENDMIFFYSYSIETENLIMFLHIYSVGHISISLFITNT